MFASLKTRLPKQTKRHIIALRVSLGKKYAKFMPNNANFLNICVYIVGKRKTRSRIGELC
jgi:hypothetical protein